MLNKIIELGIISQIAKVSNGIDWILENDDYGCHLQDLCVITSRQIFSCQASVNKNFIMGSSLFIFLPFFL